MYLINLNVRDERDDIGEKSVISLAAGRFILSNVIYQYRNSLHIAFCVFYLLFVFVSFLFFTLTSFRVCLRKCEVANR